MPSPLAINLAAGYKKFSEESNQKRDQFLEERKMLKSIGPQRWTDLRERFQQTVADMNTELGYSLLEWHDVSSNTLRIVRKNAGPELVGLYDPDRNMLAITGQRGFVPLSYEQKVLGDDVVFVTTRASENGPRSADQIIEVAFKQFIYAP